MRIDLIQEWMNDHETHFTTDQMNEIVNYMRGLQDAEINRIRAVRGYRSPSTVTMVALIGLDRFLLSDYLAGLVKLFTFGGLLGWHIADIFTAKNRTYVYNYALFCKEVAGIKVKSTMNAQDLMNLGKSVAPIVAEGAKETMRNAGEFSDSLYTPPRRYY